MKQSTSFHFPRVRNYKEFDMAQERRARAKRRQIVNMDGDFPQAEYMMVGSDLDDAISEIGRTWEVS